MYIKINTNSKNYTSILIIYVFTYLFVEGRIYAHWQITMRKYISKVDSLCNKIVFTI